MVCVKLLEAVIGVMWLCANSMKDDILVSCGKQFGDLAWFPRCQVCHNKKRTQSEFIWFTRQWSMLETVWRKVKSLCSSWLSSDLVSDIWYAIYFHISFCLLSLIFVVKTLIEHFEIYGLKICHMIHRYPFCKVFVEELKGWTGGRRNWATLAAKHTCSNSELSVGRWRWCLWWCRANLPCVGEEQLQRLLPIICIVWFPHFYF